MATNAAAAALPLSSNVTTTSRNILNFGPCPYTFVATKTKQENIPDGTDSENPRRAIVPRVCRLRTRDNAMAIYALVDPTGTKMVASDVSINMLVEQLSDISFDDDSYREKINVIMQKITYEIENRLLQMTFDHVEEQVTEKTSKGIASEKGEKLLMELDEAKSGAFLFAATVTQSNVYISYVGNIRAFMVSNDNGELAVSNSRPQYYHTDSLHTLDNYDECRRLKNLDVDIDKMGNDDLDEKHSKYTRCIGKLSEKLFSSAASANDVNEARCNPLICEPTVYNFKLMPQDYALVLMTDKVYQMYLKAGVAESELPSHLLGLLRKFEGSPNLPQSILETIEQDFRKYNENSDENLDLEGMALLIHFFQQPKNVNLPSGFIKSNIRRFVEGEVTVDEVKKFIQKHNEMQQRRERKRNSSAVFGHQREDQSYSATLEPFVRFDGYEKLLSENEELRQANTFITDLLYNESTSVLEERLTEYLNQHPSLKCD